MIKTYNEPFGPNCLAASAIMDKRKGNPKIHKSKRQSRFPNFNCLLKIISVKAFTATMLTMKV